MFHLTDTTAFPFASHSRQRGGERRFLAFVEFYRHRFGRPSGAPGCPMDRDTLIALIILVAVFVLLVVLLRK